MRFSRLKFYLEVDFYEVSLFYPGSFLRAGFGVFANRVGTEIGRPE
jgi:hypothetical protein